MKKIFYLLILIISVSCTEKENINGSPSEFEVTVSSSSFNNVEIIWSESFDPENENVVYSVYLEGQLYATNLTSRNYNFVGLVISTNYTGVVIASDSNGNETIASFSFVTTENLPPNSFELISYTASNISLDVRWTESIDPEGGEVVYDLYLDNQLLVSNYTEENYLFENLNAATIYSIKIVAKDVLENLTPLIFNAETLDGIYQGDVSLKTQDDVDSFGSLGYIEIAGNLIMDGEVYTDITDLSPINSIKKVRGFFRINRINSLTSLSGLGIEFIGYSLIISQNDNITNLEGLENLLEVLGEFRIEENGNLLNITNVNNLTTIGDSLIIYINLKLISITGFSNLNLINAIYINANTGLTTIDSFSNVNELAGDLNIVGNTSLTSLNGLNNINRIGRVFIKNTLIQNLSTLSSLSVIDGDLDVQNNTLLNNIQGLSSLNDITYGNISFYFNNSLTSLNGLENLNHVGNTVNFIGNGSLTDFCALQNLMQTFVPSSMPLIYNNLFNPTIIDISNGNCSI